jgi:hypothetical protein
MAHFLQLSEIRSDKIRQVQEYWDRLRDDRRFPAKRDIEPADIKAVLPYVLISEVHRDPLRVRYRLIGTEIAHYSGEDFTGKWLHETGWGGDYTRSVERKYVRMFETRTPVFGIDYFVQRTDGQRKPYEWAIFPLAEDGETVDFCLLVEDRQPLDRFEAPLR